MRKIILLAMLGVLCLTGRKTEAALISVGDFSVVVGTPSIDIPVLISTTTAENIRSFGLAFSVGDGGPLGGGGMETVTITAADFTTGTIWSGQSFSFGSFFEFPAQSAQISSLAIVPPNVAVVASGLLMTFSLDLSTATVGEVLLLNPNLFNLTDASDANDQRLSLTFAPGSLTITSDSSGNGPVIPEPSSMLLFAVGVVGIAGYNRKRKRQTAA